MGRRHDRRPGSLLRLHHTLRQFPRFHGLGRQVASVRSVLRQRRAECRSVLHTPQTCTSIKTSPVRGERPGSSRKSSVLTRRIPWLACRSPSGRRWTMVLGPSDSGNVTIQKAGSKRRPHDPLGRAPERARSQSPITRACEGCLQFFFRRIERATYSLFGIFTSAVTDRFEFVRRADQVETYVINRMPRP